MAAQFEGWEWFYLDENAENVGPFTTEELVEFYSAQGITDDTYIWAEQCEGWQTIDLFDDLKAILVAGSAPAAPEASSEQKAAPPAEEAAEAAKVRAKSMSKRRTSVSLPPSSTKKTELTLLKELSQKNYLEQAQWFLNAYWSAEGKKIRFDNNPEECEKVWKMYHVMCELDKKNGKNGNELDEFGAHIFLEKTVGAITVKKNAPSIS